MTSVNKQKYFFILGSNPTISIAEIFALLKNDGLLSIIDNQVAIFETEKDIQAEKLIKSLGGTIKIGLIYTQMSAVNQKALIEKSSELFAPGEGKFKFGISYYGKEKFNSKVIGMELKSTLKRRGVSCRWVISKEKTLSSVVVTQNKLCDKGAEIVYLQNGKDLYIGKTLAVQAFKELSYRDYHRPNRDSQSGMLPPKLAQIMINLADTSNEAKLLDPFCGSGTVLMEALLRGSQNVFGTDVSTKAVNDSIANLNWLLQKFAIDPSQNFEVKKQDVTELSKIFPNNYFDVIVTEPFLGPQRGNQDVKKIKIELEKLYSKAIKEFSKVLRPEGTIVMLWPVLTTNRNKQITNSKSRKTELTYITPQYPDFKIVQALPEKLFPRNPELTHRSTLLYGREGQRVWREIVIMKKIKK